MVKEKDQEPDSKAVAEHELLNAAGESPEDLREEEAVGIRYTLLGNKQSVQVMWDDLSEDAQRMAGLFGLKTRFTNDTSGVRNQKKNGVKQSEFDYDAQIAAVRATVADLEKGIWIDRTREPGVPRIDKDALARAIVQVMVDGGKVAAGDVDTTIAEKRARLDSDAPAGPGLPSYLAYVRTNAKVAEAYAAIIGKKVATADDL